MAKLVKFQLDDDEQSFVYMEVDEKLPVGSDEDEDEYNEEIGIIDEVAQKAEQTLRKALSGIKPVAKAVIEEVEDLKADAVEVKFGVKVSGKLGAVIASGSADVNYEITLKWNNAGSKSN